MTFLDLLQDVGGDTGEEASGDPLVSQFSVSSSCIAGLAYHWDSNDLDITFQDGREYTIPNFPMAELSRWLASGSIGGYFNSFIRGNY